MKNIILIGFMGSGKTSCGKALAEKTSMNFCDTDEMIEEQQKMSVSEIFERHGEPYFRKLETELVKSLTDKEIGVLSVGGGLAVTPGNGELLKRAGLVIYLRAGIECLVDRLKSDNTRPLLAGGDLEEKIASLMEMRQEAYISAADLIIDTDNLTVEEVADKILDSLGGEFAVGS